MRKRDSDEALHEGIITLVFFFAIAFSWIGNLYKLTQCDFESPWKGEAIHAVGLFGPASLITVWFSDK